MRLSNCCHAEPISDTEVCSVCLESASFLPEGCELIFRILNYLMLIFSNYPDNAELTIGQVKAVIEAMKQALEEEIQN